MNMRLTLLALLLVSLSLHGEIQDIPSTPETPAAPAPSPGDELAKLVLPVEPESELAKQIVALLAPLPSLPRKAVKSFITPNQQFILYGDLFRKGKTFALVSLSTLDLQGAVTIPGRIAFAERTKKGWELRGLWQIGGCWGLKTVSADEEESWMKKMPTAPFELVDFFNDGTPEVVVASDLGRYFHIHYVLLFDSAKDQLKLQAESDFVPGKIGNYLRLDSDSGHKSTWSKSAFWHLEKGKLVEAASWRDGTLNNGARFFIVRVRKSNGETEEFRMEEPNGASRYDVTLDGKPYAVVKFFASPAAKGNSEQWEIIWLFHHLTGLPIRFYPGIEYVTDKLLRFEDQGAVTVEGSAEAIKRLNPWQGKK